MIKLTLLTFAWCFFAIKVHCRKRLATSETVHKVDGRWDDGDAVRSNTLLVKNHYYKWCYQTQWCYNGGWGENTSSLEGKVYTGAMEGEPSHYVYADQIWQILWRL